MLGVILSQEIVSCLKGGISSLALHTLRRVQSIMYLLRPDVRAEWKYSQFWLIENGILLPTQITKDIFIFYKCLFLISLNLIGQKKDKSPGRERDCNFYMSAYMQRIYLTFRWTQTWLLMHITSLKTLILSHLNFVSALGIMFVFTKDSHVWTPSSKDRIFRGEPFCTCIKSYQINHNQNSLSEHPNSASSFGSFLRMSAMQK